MAVVAVTASSFLKQPELVAWTKQRLLGHEIRLREPADGIPRGEALASFLDGADAAIIGRETIDASLLKSLPRLKALALYGVGFDNVNLDACKSAGVRFLVSHGVNAGAVAEHTIGLMLAVMRNIAYTDRLLHQGIWLKDGGRQLSGKTVGIVGCGAVGAKLAQLLRAFACPLLLCDIADKSVLARETGGKLCGFKETIENADVLTLHVPLTPLTKGFINEHVLETMKASSILINTSRGGVVQLDALAKALKSGRLAGAGLDVFETEPMLDPDIYSLQQLVATPHIAGNAREAVWAMGTAAVENLVRFLSSDT